MRYFSALCARMYRLSANSRATISSTAIFLSQQSRQYFSSPRGSETSFALQSAQRTCATDLRDIQDELYQLRNSATSNSQLTPNSQGPTAKRLGFELGFWTLAPGGLEVGVMKL